MRCCSFIKFQVLSCSSFVRDQALVHERGVYDLQQVERQVGGHRLWHVALEGGWPHPQKVSATFIIEKWSKIFLKNVRFKLRLSSVLTAFIIPADTFTTKLHAVAPTVSSTSELAIDLLQGPKMDLSDEEARRPHWDPVTIWTFLSNCHHLFIPATPQVCCLETVWKVGRTASQMQDLQQGLQDGQGEHTHLVETRREDSSQWCFTDSDIRERLWTPTNNPASLEERHRYLPEGISTEAGHWRSPHPDDSFRSSTYLFGYWCGIQEILPDAG